jgi:hypothetical protein
MQRVVPALDLGSLPGQSRHTLRAAISVHSMGYLHYLHIPTALQGYHAVVTDLMQAMRHAVEPAKRGGIGTRA